MRKRIVLVLLITVAAAGAVWAVVHFTVARRNRLRESADTLARSANNASADAWAAAVEKVKAARVEDSGALVIPPELKHHSERYWFLATQVAEIEKCKVHTCQDYLDLALLIEQGELVAVPAVTDTYVLFGVGAKADDSAFTRYVDDHDVGLYTETQLSEAYRQLVEKRSNLQSQIASLNAQSGRLGKRERTKRSELQKQISTLDQELKATDEDKAALDQFYGHPETRQKLFRDYQSLETLAKNFAGRSYSLDSLSDRQALKINMLRSLRPEALKILEQVASVYQRQFDRPLPVSSLVRPEQYQHALRRVNRNAVLIDSPPHSTGLAFDIDYRYMSATEQTFLMGELARLKIEGRIEVIRERNANYHVFAFVNGTRPTDDLITASLEKAGAPAEKAHHTPGKATPAKNEAKNKAKGRTTKARKPRSTNPRSRKRRR